MAQTVDFEMRQGTPPELALDLVYRLAGVMWDQVEVRKQIGSELNWNSENFAQCLSHSCENQSWTMHHVPDEQGTTYYIIKARPGQNRAYPITAVATKLGAALAIALAKVTRCNMDNEEDFWRVINEYKHEQHA